MFAIPVGASPNSPATSSNSYSISMDDESNRTETATCSASASNKVSEIQWEKRDEENQRTAISRRENKLNNALRETRHQKESHTSLIFKFIARKVIKEDKIVHKASGWCLHRVLA